jgi:hypothetical protein
MPIDVVAVRLIHQIGSAPLEAIDRFIWRQGWYIVTIIKRDGNFFGLQKCDF